MPGTFTTDLTTIRAAEATSDVSQIGTQNVALATNDDYKIEGTNCLTIGLSSGKGTGTLSLVAVTQAGNENWTGAGSHLYSWIKVAAWPSMANQRNGGLRIAISSDAPPTAIRSVLQATVTAGGSGYSVGNTLTLTGGTGTAAQLTVTAVSSGAVTAVSPVATARGAYTVLPGNPISTTVSPAGGTGCTLNIAGTGNPPDGWIYTLTNSKEWFVGGADNVVVDGWVPYVVDIDGTPDLNTGGSMSSVDRAGWTGTMVATGKVVTHIMDVVRRGTGLTVNDGTSGSPVTMADVQVYDNANARAWGIVTTQQGIYFLAGKIRVGTTGQSAVTYFKDTSQVYVWMPFPVASTFYEFLLAGAASFNTTFQLGSLSGGVASGGVTVRGANRYTHYAGVATGLVPAIWTLTANASNTVCNLYGSTFSEMLAALFASNSDVQFCTFVNCGQITPNGATIKNCTFLDLRTTSPISASYQIAVATSTPVLTGNRFTNCQSGVSWNVNGDTNGKLDDCSFTYGASLAAGTPGHAIEFGSNTPAAITLQDVTLSGYGATEFGFHTTNDVDAGADTISEVGHGYTTGERVMYRKQGGSVNMGLTDATVYYVRADSSSLIGVFPTNADALANTNRIALTSTGSETHYIASMAAAVYNNKGGAIEITIGGTGTTPSVRNGSGSSTTLVTGQTTVTLTGLVNGSEVRVYDSGDNSVIDGVESVTGNQFSFTDDTGNTVYIRIFNTQYLPADIMDYVIPASDTSVPVQQIFDRNFSNP